MDRVNNTERLVLTVEQTRQLLGLSRGAVYQAVGSGQIPSIRVGRRILIPRIRLEQMINGPKFNPGS